MKRQRDNMLDNFENTDDLSQLDIDLDVVAAIASRAALEIEGVASIDSSWQDVISATLGKDNRAVGVKVTIVDNQLCFNINVITNYGVRIPEVAWNLQEHIKKTIEESVGVKVAKVNVLISGIKGP